jgi:hypothetical protein
MKAPCLFRLGCSSPHVKLLRSPLYRIRIFYYLFCIRGEMMIMSLNFFLFAQELLVYKVSIFRFYLSSIVSSVFRTCKKGSTAILLLKKKGIEQKGKKRKGEQNKAEQPIYMRNTRKYAKEGEGSNTFSIAYSPSHSSPTPHSTGGDQRSSH